MRLQITLRQIKFMPAFAVLFANCALADPCHIGAYRLADGRAIDIGPTADGALRWRLEDGSSGKLTRAGNEWRSTLGWTDRMDGHRVSLEACATGEMQFDGARGARIPLEVTETKFAVEGAELAGAVMFPRAEHGLYEFELDAKGERISLGLPKGYLDLMRDYVLTGRLTGDYGDAVVVR